MDDVQSEAGFRDVEGVGGVHVRDGNQHEFELEIHDAASLRSVGSASIVPVMPAAPSDARNTATSTTSASLGARHSAAIPAIISTTDRGSGAFAPPTSVSFFSDSVSATPAVQMPQTRTPRGPTSAARYRMNASVAASAGPVLPIPGIAPAPDALLRCKITPKPCSIMSRPAARAVRKLLRRPLTTARKRSSAVISTSGCPGRPRG